MPQINLRHFCWYLYFFLLSLALVLLFSGIGSQSAAADRTLVLFVLYWAVNS
jgi:hypothetical protein